MVDGYQPYFNEVERALSEIGFEVEENANFRAIFRDASDWKIIFEGEILSAPAFNLILRCSRDGKKKEFEVGMIMEVMGLEERPTLKNQLKVIGNRRAELMPLGNIPYENKYDALNKIG